MVEIIKNLITEDEIQEILEWYFVDDGRFDDRGNVRSKTITEDFGPIHIIMNFLEKAVDFEPAITKMIITESRSAATRLHVDTDDNDPSVWGKNFLIPLQYEGPADTIWFDNYWYGSDVRFMRKLPSLYEYEIKDDFGKWYMFDDIRELKKLDEGTKYVKDGHSFTISRELIELINYIINVRENGNIKSRTNEYEKIVNYNPELKFDSKLQAEYIHHVPLENLHGLTVDKIVEWKLGETYAWDRSQLHTSSSRHLNKIGLSVFVNKKV